MFLLSQKILISNKRSCTHANAFAFNIRQHNDDPNLNVYKFELCAAAEQSHHVTKAVRFGGLIF